MHVHNAGNYHTVQNISCSTVVSDCNVMLFWEMCLLIWCSYVMLNEKDLFLLAHITSLRIVKIHISSSICCDIIFYIILPTLFLIVCKARDPRIKGYSTVAICIILHNRATEWKWWWKSKQEERGRLVGRWKNTDHKLLNIMKETS